MSISVQMENKYQTAVIYARYSSHNQRDVSLDQQIKACRQFADRQGIEILGTYEDHALTGTNDKRPGFQRMIRDSMKGGWDYVIVYSLDRFARDRYDSAVYKRQLKNAGIRVLSAMEQISDDPTGVLMESLLEGLAEYYSKELSQKIRRGMEDNASKCMVTGALPLGYVKGPDGRYAIQEDEAAIVREIYGRVAKQDKICDIIQDLNARGIKTKSGKDWNKSSFNRLLSNERFTGVYIYKDIRIPGGIPPIISQELFNKVQYAVTSKPNPRTLGPQRRRNENGLYMLTGKLYCGLCKEPMVGVSGRGKHGELHYYYVCKGKRLHHSCTMKNIQRDQIEQSVATALKDTMLTDEAICALADAAIAYQQKQLADSDIGPLTIQIQDVERSINNLVKAIEMGVCTPSTQSRLLELEHQQKVLSGQLAAAQADAEELMTREEIIATLKLFQDGDTTDKDFQQALIDTFLVRAYIYDDKIKYIFHVGGKDTPTEIPFDIEDLDLSPDPVSESDTKSIFQTIVRIKDSRLHHKKEAPTWVPLFLLKCLLDFPRLQPSSRVKNSFNTGTFVPFYRKSQSNSQYYV